MYILWIHYISLGSNFRGFRSRFKPRFYNKHITSLSLLLVTEEYTFCVLLNVNINDIKSLA